LSGEGHGRWPDSVTSYDSLHPIGREEFDAIVECILMSAAKAKRGTSPGWIRIGSAQGPRNIPKFRKVQPYERPDLQVAGCWMCAARPIMVAPASQAATIFLFTE